MTKLLYVQISEDITEQIKVKQLKENDKLSERKLAEQYKVSRAVVRDALKLLNEKGLVETSSGRGTFVKIPDGQELMGKFEQALNNSCISSVTAVEAREVIELSYVELISQRATEENIAKLNEMLMAMEDSIENLVLFATLDESFHLLLSECTQNEVMKIFCGALNTITNRDRLLSTKEIRENALKEHRNIVKAIEARDSQLLREEMSNHLRCVRINVVGQPN